MTETTGQKTPDNPTLPEKQSSEIITDPKRLAELVLNTMNETVHSDLLYIDPTIINGFMENPSLNWEEIIKLVNQTREKAAKIENPAQLFSFALNIITHYPNQGLPITEAGNPPKTIIDLQAAKALSERKTAETTDKQTRKEWDKTDSQILADPLRSLALLISRFYEDSIVQDLTIIKGYGYNLTNKYPNYDPNAEFMVEEFATGLSNSYKYTQLTRNTLSAFAQGNLPDHKTIKVILSGGSNAIPAYLDTFNSPITK